MAIFFRYFFISWGLLFVLAALFSLFGPREDGTLDYVFLEDQLGGDVDAYLASQEGRYPDITPGTEKRVIWAGKPGQRTALSVIYVHGFSATSEEIRPVPDRIAEALGANLVFTRLSGHGRPGDELNSVSASDWTMDTAEAIEVGRAVGDRVIVIGTSTGATLLAGAIAEAPTVADDIKGAIFLSPNFGLNSSMAFLLDWPGARYWLGWVAGHRIQFESSSAAHATYWTRDYPTTALLPMAALVKSVLELDFETALVDALFWYSPNDQVVRPDLIERVADAWDRGFASATIGHPALSEGDDPNSHVVAGEILSPNQTEATVSAMLEWIAGLD